LCCLVRIVSSQAERGKALNDEDDDDEQLTGQTEKAMAIDDNDDETVRRLRETMTRAFREAWETMDRLVDLVGEDDATRVMEECDRMAHLQIGHAASR
jgi:hypothetical protein